MQARQNVARHFTICLLEMLHQPQKKKKKKKNACQVMQIAQGELPIVHTVLYYEAIQLYTGIIVKYLSQTVITLKISRISVALSQPSGVICSFGTIW